MKKITLATMGKRAYTRYVQMQTSADSERLEKSQDPIEPNGSSVTADSVGDEGEHLDNVSSNSDIEVVEYNHPHETVVEPSQGNSFKCVALMRPNGNISISITPVPIETLSSVVSDAVSVSTIKATTIAKEDATTNNDSPRKRGAKRKLANTAAEDVDERIVHNAGRKKTSSLAIFKSNVPFKDFAGSASMIERICQLLLHLKHPEIYSALGTTLPGRILLYGFPGCGKSLLASATTGAPNLPKLNLAATELLLDISWELKNNIRGLFQQALDLAPSIIFIDEIDAKTPMRQHTLKEMERMKISVLLSCIDGFSSAPKGDSVVLIGATNRIETIAGRFEREISIGMPKRESGEQMFRAVCTNLKLEPNFDFKNFPTDYVGTNSPALINEDTVHVVEEANPNEGQQSTAGHGTKKKRKVEIDEPQRIRLGIPFIVWGGERITNTCTFDNFLQILLVAYKTKATVRAFFESVAEDSNPKTPIIHGILKKLLSEDFEGAKLAWTNEIVGRPLTPEGIIDCEGFEDDYYIRPWKTIYSGLLIDDCRDHPGSAERIRKRGCWDYYSFPQMLASLNGTQTPGICTEDGCTAGISFRHEAIGRSPILMFDVWGLCKRSVTPNKFPAVASLQGKSYELLGYTVNQPYNRRYRHFASSFAVDGKWYGYNGLNWDFEDVITKGAVSTVFYAIK